MKSWLAPFIFLCLPALAPAEVPKKAAAETEAAPALGLVWKIEGGKVPVYLAGSFHLLRKKDLPYPESIDTAYADSQQLWFEIPPGEMEKPESILRMMTLGMLPPDQSLDDVISAECYEKVQHWAEKNPTFAGATERMRPWMVALTIMLTEYQKLGADPNNGIEKLLEAKASHDAKPTGGFESVDEQLGFFSDMTAEKQQELLIQTFDELAESRKLIKDMLGAWRRGEDEKLASLMAKSFDGHDDIKKTLLDDRNARWIEPIEKLLAGDKKTMVIVGAGHLCGPGSVIDLLRKKGWKITRVGG